MIRFLKQKFSKKRTKVKLISGFDEKKYLIANPDVESAIEKEEFQDALHHLQLFGLEEIKNGLRKFHTSFEVYNEMEYLKIFPDIKNAVHKGDFDSGFQHFMYFGYQEIINGERIWKKKHEVTPVNCNVSSSVKSIVFGPIIHSPLVSIIAVNFNGEKDLPKFLDSLQEQTYENFELVIIDNNSFDNSINIIEKYKEKFKNLKIIKNSVNVGYAEANNNALPYCKGELLALINVDTIADKNWLYSLVDTLKIHNHCAAVTSKTLFFREFQDIKIESKEVFKLSLDHLIASLDYKKYFVRQGLIDKKYIESENNCIIISLPIQDRLIHLFTKENKKETEKLYKITYSEERHFTFRSNNLDYNLDFSKSAVQDSKYIINNAGTILNHNNMPIDRGFGEYDNGQYEEEMSVCAFCGVSVLLRRIAIANRGIFIPEFFAYYEDSELSRWLLNENFTIKYTPKSILYHKHATTSSEGSPLWNLLVRRSSEIYNYNSNIQASPIDLNFNMDYYEEYYKQQVSNEIYTILKEYTEKLINRINKTNTLVQTKYVIGIYNSFWNTKGGGESHALAFASILQEYSMVYLISENDFDIDELAGYYNIKLDNCYKLIETNISKEYTRKFDIFINSTYGSNLDSIAKESYYIVSFPHKNIDTNILNSYTFLYNSDYTKKWADKFWGTQHMSKLIYPLGMLNSKIKNDLKKEKIILSVGRFFLGNHTKNQNVIAKSYKELIEKNPSLKEWKLVLIGSLNETSLDDVNYVEEIKNILQGLNYELLANAPRNILETYYEKASLYIHMTGYGQNISKEPENFEHFGITPLEAMLNGCFPIVYDVGGPAEILNYLSVGQLVSSYNELMQAILAFVEGKISYEFGEIQYKTLQFIKKNDFKNVVINTFNKEG